MENKEIEKCEKKVKKYQNLAVKAGDLAIKFPSTVNLLTLWGVGALFGAIGLGVYTDGQINGEMRNILSNETSQQKINDMMNATNTTDANSLSELMESIRIAHYTDYGTLDNTVVGQTYQNFTQLINDARVQAENTVDTSGVIDGYFRGLNTIAIGLILGKLGIIKMSHIFQYLSIKNEKKLEDLKRKQKPKKEIQQTL